ncbi:MAG: hypothetical protein ACLU6Y_17435 [Ruminococcus sp.]
MLWLATFTDHRMTDFYERPQYREAFGDHTDIYDMTQAVEDGATVRRYESLCYR